MTSRRTPIISMTDAAFGYDATPVVEHVTLDIQPGEVVAVLGPNGAGKSTLVKGLVGLTSHLAGTVTVLDEALADRTDPSRIGYVPQRHTLATSVRCTVAEIVSIGRLRFRSRWRPWQRPAEGDRQAVARVLDLVGLGDRAGSDVSQLSGGQQRRVLIARALASAPDVLIMDEPTAGVDRSNQAVLATVLARLAEAGTTMIVVTHELAALAKVVTRVLVVSDGRLVFDGTPDSYAAQHDHHGGGHGDGHSPTTWTAPAAGRRAVAPGLDLAPLDGQGGSRA